MEEGSGFKSFFIGAFIFILIFLGWDWLKEYTNKPKFYESDDMSSYTSARRKGWDLWIYSTDTPNTEHEIFEQLGLSSKSQCMTEGLARTRNGGSYQCGYNCYSTTSQFQKFDPVNIDVCETICERSGCRN
jgi:hypothetical protein